MTLDSATLLYTYISRFSVNPQHQQKRIIRQSCHHQFYPQPLFNFSYNRPTFAFTSESGHTLGSRRKIAHNGSHGETGGFTFVQSCRAFDRPSSGKRTAGGSGCTPMACVRFLRHHSPAGLRNILFDLPMLYFSRSAHGDFCVCEVKAVSLPSAYSAYCRNSRCPLVKTTNLLFPWSDRFFFDSSSAKYYPFFFTDTGRTSGQPAGSFAFVCIFLTCPDRPDRGT